LIECRSAGGEVEVALKNDDGEQKENDGAPMKIPHRVQKGKKNAQGRVKFGGGWGRGKGRRRGAQDGRPRNPESVGGPVYKK